MYGTYNDTHRLYCLLQEGWVPSQTTQHYWPVYSEESYFCHSKMTQLFLFPFFFNAGTNIAVLGRHALPIFWLFYSPSHPFKKSSHLNPSVPALIKSIASDLSICFMTCVKILNQFSSLCEQVSILKSLLSHTVLANYPEGWHPVHSAACKAFLTFLNYYDIGKFKL